LQNQANQKVASLIKQDQIPPFDKISLNVSEVHTFSVQSVLFPAYFYPTTYTTPYH